MIQYLTTNRTIERIPSKLNLCEFSPSIKLCQRHKGQPVLFGWASSKQKKWLEEQEFSVVISDLYVKSSKYIRRHRSSRWDGFIYEVEFPSMAELLLFVLTFR